MPRNSEIKCQLKDPASVHIKAKELSHSDGKVLNQEDIFFHSPNGKLKLRIIKGDHEELIHYDRPETEAPKISDYTKVDRPLGELSGDMLRLLTNSMGIYGKVKKKRKLYLIGQTRVHLDEVDGLGNFMELEVVLEDSQTAEDGHKIAVDLMKALGISEESLLSKAYVDLLKETMA